MGITRRKVIPHLNKEVHVGTFRAPSWYLAKVPGWYNREWQRNHSPMEPRTKNQEPRMHRESGGNLDSCFLVPWENAFFSQRMHSSIMLSRLLLYIQVLSRTDLKHTTCVTDPVDPTNETRQDEQLLFFWGAYQYNPIYILYTYIIYNMYNYTPR